MAEEQVILVDKYDNQIGLMSKLQAHQIGVLHRAFSIFIFNKKNELMLQQRSSKKYHSPLLWSNTCCSHQRVGESNIQAGKRRLKEEMGFSTDLEEIFSFVYKVSFDNGLFEHELDHVLVGYWESSPKINVSEVEGWKWMSLEDIKRDINLRPQIYTAWFKIIFDKFYKHLNLNT